jgi:hypothetical protein
MGDRAQIVAFFKPKGARLRLNLKSLIDFNGRRAASTPPFAKTGIDSDISRPAAVE